MVYSANYAIILVTLHQYAVPNHNHLEAKANFVTGLQSSANPWVLDTSATHHITPEPHDMPTYNGIEEVTLGDGNKIPITHNGSTSLHASNSVFHLSNTLCAPHIKRNLISISNFCKENLTSIEFFPFEFLVKNLATQTPLVHGRNRNGLYEWPSTSTSPSPQTTQLQLGTANLVILMLKSYTLSYTIILFLCQN